MLNYIGADKAGKISIPIVGTMWKRDGYNALPYIKIMNELLENKTISILNL
jgi:hypothetical protein